jgi:hypothetical protein
MPRFDPAAAQQDTIVEWRASPSHGRTCTRCHMAGSTADGHAFAGGRDHAMLDAAVDVHARADREGDAIDVTFVLRARGVGHAFPTGDLFRRLRVAARTDASESHDDLRRVFAAQRVGERFVIAEVEDTRLRPQTARTLHLRLADAHADTVRWSLTMLRLDPEVAATRALPDELVRVPVAEGSVRLRRAERASTTAAASRRPSRPRPR